jgi:hypothetical protein
MVTKLDSDKMSFLTIISHIATLVSLIVIGGLVAKLWTNSLQIIEFQEYVDRVTADRYGREQMIEWQVDFVSKNELKPANVPFFDLPEKPDLTPLID